MNRPTGYSGLAYGDFITSEPRMSAYADALRQAIAPSCTVIDFGAGTGIFSIFACKYGVEAAIAIEPRATLTLLRATAKDNDRADKIAVIQDLSTDYTPRRKAGVIVPEVRGHCHYLKATSRQLSTQEHGCWHRLGREFPRETRSNVPLPQLPNAFEAANNPATTGGRITCGHVRGLP